MATSWNQPWGTDWHWNQQSWQPQSWEANEWRGKPRPGPARISSAQLQEQGQPADSEYAAREQGKWRDPKHEWEDHQILRCPWPGGIKTFPSWQDVVADAAEQGLVQLLVQWLFFSLLT